MGLFFAGRDTQYRSKIYMNRLDVFRVGEKGRKIGVEKRVSRVHIILVVVGFASAFE